VTRAPCFVDARGDRNQDTLIMPLDEHGDIQSSVEYFRRFAVPEDATILDVGTRFGTFLEELRGLSYTNIRGIDVNPEAIDEGRAAYPNLRDRIEVYEGGVLPYGDAEFDVVTAFDVLEHVPDTAGFLSEIRRVLKPGGRFLFQTPNRLTNIPWEIVKQGSLSRWQSYHCSLQTLGSLRRHLAKAGFADIAIERYGLQSEHKVHRIRQNLGPAAVALLRIARRLPLPVFPNFWGHCVKP
jgi:SAM-dependent methyltransferase